MLYFYTSLHSIDANGAAGTGPGEKLCYPQLCSNSLGGESGSLKGKKKKKKVIARWEN